MPVVNATVRCVAPSSDELGEGPCWSPADGRLYWFDIMAARLSWLEPASGASGRWTLPVRASAAAPRERGGLIVATEVGLGHVNTRTGAFELARAVKLEPGFRTNDGKIDPLGRFWWSVMDEGGLRSGGVYVTLPSGQTMRMLDEVMIPNTLTSTADGATLYVADSAAKTIQTYRVDPTTGELADGSPFVDLTGEAGTPDGSAMDAEGFLWNAQWGAWRVVRYSPTGEVDRIIETPVEQPTSCAFGGPDLATLYITSARSELSDRALAGQTLAGGLFAIEPGVRGLALPAFAG